MKALQKIKNFHAVQMADPIKCHLSFGDKRPVSYLDVNNDLLAFGHFGHKKPVFWVGGKK